MSSNEIKSALTSHRNQITTLLDYVRFPWCKEMALLCIDDFDLTIFHGLITILDNDMSVILPTILLPVKCFYGDVIIDTQSGGRLSFCVDIQSLDLLTAQTLCMIPDL